MTCSSILRLLRHDGFTSLLFIGPMFIFGANSFAQSGLLEEVIVTAQKRAQPLQEVGIAITVFTDQDFKFFGFTNSTEITAFTPGVYAAGTDVGGSQAFSIRGATQNDFAATAEAPNAVYVDEGYQATSSSQTFAIFDMERVEILKGPQGTLFGRNATGGLVHYITKKPTREFEAYADLTYGAYDTVRFEGALSSAIGDTTSIRLSVFQNRHDTVLENTFTTADLPATPGFLAGQGRGPLTTNSNDADDLWSDDQWAVRGQLLFEPNETFTILLKGNYSQSKPGAIPHQHAATVAFVDDTDGDGIEDQTVDTALAADVLSPGFQCELISVNTGTCVNSAFDLDFDAVRPNAQGDFFGHFETDGLEGLDIQAGNATADNDRAKLYGFTGKLTWDLDWASLIVVSSYSNQKSRFALDIDYGPAPQLVLPRENEVDWFTQELRLEGETDSFRWITGAYYLNIDNKFSNGLADAVGGINVFGGLFFNGFLSTANDFLEGTLNAELDTNSYSLFGQVDYDLSDQLVLNIGIRGIIEEKDYVYNNRLYINTLDHRTEGALFGGGTALTLPGTNIPFEFLPPFQDSSSDFLWSGKIQLNWMPNDDLLVYGGFNRGVKAGSFNAPLLTFLAQEDYRYDEEILLSYEIGFKSTFFDNRAQLNVAAYYYDYKDYQGFQFVGTSGAVFNVDSVNKGFEIELLTSPIDNLELMFGLGYIDAKVKDILVAPNTPRDVEPAFTPEVQFNALGRYTWPNSVLGGSLSLQVDGNYASSAFHNINNFGTHKMESYWLGNARIRWLSVDERWEVSGFVNNFSDTRYQVSGFELASVCGCDEQTIGRPRWWGVNVRYNYF